jgi:hypothetical protein
MPHPWQRQIKQKKTPWRQAVNEGDLHRAQMARSDGPYFRGSRFAALHAAQAMVRGTQEKDADGAFDLNVLTGPAATPAQALCLPCPPGDLFSARRTRY